MGGGCDRSRLKVVRGSGQEEVQEEDKEEGGGEGPVGKWHR